MCTHNPRHLTSLQLQINTRKFLWNQRNTDKVVNKNKKTRACRRVPLDAFRWTPKGETNGLSTLYVQKAHEVDVGHTVSVFCGRRVKISIIHNYNLTENFGAVGISFRTLGGGGIFRYREGGEFSYLPQ